MDPPPLPTPPKKNGSSTTWGNLADYYGIPDLDPLGGLGNDNMVVHRFMVSEDVSIRHTVAATRIRLRAYCHSGLSGKAVCTGPDIISAPSKYDSPR